VLMLETFKGSSGVSSGGGFHDGGAMFFIFLDKMVRIQHSGLLKRRRMHGFRLGAFQTLVLGGDAWWNFLERNFPSTRASINDDS